MSKRKLTFLIALFAGVLVTGAVFLTFNWQKEQKIHPVANNKFSEMPLMEVRGVKFTQLDNEGRELWILEADKATQLSTRTILKNAKVKLFEQGIPASEGTAERVIIKNSSSNFHLEGNIYIISYRDGAELKTSELMWDSSKRRLYTEKEVVIRKKGLVIKGTGLIGKPDLSLIIIKRQVTTYFEGGF